MGVRGPLLPLGLESIESRRRRLEPEKLRLGWLALNQHDVPQTSQAYLEKMQETVNENNWDDVLDNFTCFFALQKHLQGERSQQIFQMVWKDRAFRACVQQAVLFEEVLPVNHPPVFVIHTVKKAVGYIKDNAESWEKAIAKELAAIELTRTRQSQFFTFLVSAVTGVFMYIATFLSSVTFQAFQEGRLTLPYLSEWLHD